jgi:hypothetical protein
VTASFNKTAINALTGRPSMAANSARATTNAGEIETGGTLRRGEAFDREGIACNSFRFGRCIQQRWWNKKRRPFSKAGALTFTLGAYSSAGDYAATRLQLT